MTRKASRAYQLVASQMKEGIAKSHKITVSTIGRLDMRRVISRVICMNLHSLCYLKHVSQAAVEGAHHFKSRIVV